MTRLKKKFENEEETTDKEEKQEKSDILGIITLIKEVYKQLKKDILNLLDYIICHAIKIKELNVSSKFGMGKPMYTGIATGAVNAGVYNIVGWIDRRMNLKNGMCRLTLILIMRAWIWTYIANLGQTVYMF